jgi:cytochrome c oxidase subunit 2
MPTWFPEGASTYAGQMDHLFIVVTVIVGVFLLISEALLIYFALRYRRVEGRKAAYVPARTLRTMAFVLVPCTVILGFDLVIDAMAAPVWDEIKQTLPPAEERVRIEGQQWFWGFTYPGPDGRFDTADDIKTINDLHVPVGRVVVFELTSKDVLHSLWIPALRLKQDAVPGRTIRGWFEATREGRFEVICAEICGLQHTMMKGMMTAESPAAYDSWIASKAAAAAASGSGQGPA